MSEFAIPRRAGLRRAGDRARRVGRALWVLLKGAGLGLAWCFAMLVGFAALMCAAQPDAVFNPFLDNHTRTMGGVMADHRGPLMIVRAIFMVFGSLGWLAAYGLAQSLENWAKLRPETVPVRPAAASSPPAGQKWQWPRVVSVSRITANVLLSLALGVGFACAGYAIVKSQGALLLRSDAAVAATETWTPYGPQSVQSARMGALLSFGFGVLSAFASLFPFVWVYCQIEEAVGSYRHRGDES